jgi:hypothetical protein
MKNKNTEDQGIECGVPQGGVLSPILKRWEEYE